MVGALAARHQGKWRLGMTFFAFRPWIPYNVVAIPPGGISHTTVRRWVAATVVRSLKVEYQDVARFHIPGDEAVRRIVPRGFVIRTPHTVWRAHELCSIW